MSDIGHTRIWEAVASFSDISQIVKLRVHPVRVAPNHRSCIFAACRLPWCTSAHALRRRIHLKAWRRCISSAAPPTRAARQNRSAAKMRSSIGSTGSSGRAPAIIVLLDSRGRQMTSENFAAWLGAQRDNGAQQIVFAIGPADGWSEASRKRATLLLSLGPFTLAHALARVVMAEQLYRAFTILTGHPYHSGH